MPDLVDWGLAERIAVRAAGREPLADSYLADSLAADFEELTAQAEELVEAETGLRSLAGPARGQVTDRAGWVRANIASFQRLLSPVTDRFEKRIAGPGASRSGEAELYAIGSLASEAMAAQSLLQEILDRKIPVVIESDSSAGIAAASRDGLGGLKHVEIRFLAIQQWVKDRNVKIKKRPTEANESDVLTKHVDGGTLKRHLEALGRYQGVAMRVQEVSASGLPLSKTCGSARRSGRVLLRE